MATLARLSPEERIGIGAAVVAHVALAAALMWQATREMEPIVPPERIDVSLATDVSLESTAPDPSAEPAASFAPVVTDLPQPSEPEPITAPPVRPRPAPTVEPRPVPTTRPTARPTTRPTPAPTPTSRATSRPTPAPTPTATRRAGGSRLSENFLEGASTTEGNSGSPAVTFGAAERSALNSAITRILRARWRGSAPTGADAELLRSNVTWRLNRDGSVRGTPTCRQTGTVTEANRPQSQLHCERAIRAVMTADFSSLPERFYSEWDYLEWDFDRSLL